MNLSVCLDILKKQTPVEELLFIGGSAQSPVWQRGVADIFGTRVLVPRILEEANSMGAAVIAGVGSGLYSDFSAISRFLDITEELEVNRDVHRQYQEAKEEFNRIYMALEPLFFNQQ